MGVITSQKITTYYERFKAIDVTFSKEIINVTGLITQQVFLKCSGDFWPCVIYSSSFQGAKVAASVQSGLIQKLQAANNSVSLRFCFKNPDKETPVTFFVSTRVAGYAPHNGSNDVALFSLQYTQRPPDDLIEIIGRVLDATVNSAKRREERIILTPDSIRKLNILAKETAVFIQGVPRRCMLRDLSFSGAKIIMMGISKFLVNREAALRIDFDDPRESFSIKGTFIRSEAVEGRKELIALAVQFTDQVPMGYKVRLNEYLGSKIDNKTPPSERPEASPYSDPAPAVPPSGPPDAAENAPKAAFSGGTPAE
ncbi:MAG: PilZ domain-containing protein [Treponema sp.]|nr:PilZ domain-containing protein [Treponema sp.]